MGLHRRDAIIFLPLRHAGKHTGASIPRAGSPSMSSAAGSRGCDTSSLHLFSACWKWVVCMALLSLLPCKMNLCTGEGASTRSRDAARPQSDKNVMHKKRNVIPNWTNTNTLVIAVSSCHHELLVRKDRTLDSLCLMCNSHH